MALSLAISAGQRVKDPHFFFLFLLDAVPAPSAASSSAPSSATGSSVAATGSSALVEGKGDAEMSAVDFFLAFSFS